MSLFMMFIFFCFFAVLCMLFFLYGRHCGESNAYGLGITVGDLGVRISEYEKKIKWHNDKLEYFEKKLKSKDEEIEDFKKLADTYLKETIGYCDQIRALEEELNEYRFISKPASKSVDICCAEPKRRPGRPRKTLPPAPLISEAI